MKIQTLFALALAFAVSCFAGQALVTVDKDSLYYTNLLGIDSLKFEKDRRGLDSTFRDSLFVIGYGSKTLPKTPLSKFHSITFNTNYHDDEMMIVNVTTGPFKGMHLFPLKDVRYVEIDSSDNTKDSDGDGLLDRDEIFKWGTNPNDKDTDGDGFSDKEELNSYNPDSPTSWNPNVADVPELGITMLSTPEIYLITATSETETSTETISKGSSTSSLVGISKSEQQSASLMNGWNFSLTIGRKFVDTNPYASISLGYKGSFTETTGHTWTSNEQKTVSENFSDAITRANSNGTTIKGAKICMEAAITNLSNISYTISSMKLSASAYSRNGNVDVISELNVDGGWKEMTLIAGNSMKKLFCNDKLTLTEVEGLIYNPAAIFLDAATFKITANFKNQAIIRDFTEIYTDVNAKTALITIDYGPYHDIEKKQVESFHVATNYLFNEKALDRKKIYNKMTLADVMNILKYDYEEGKKTNAKGETHSGLIKLNNVTYSTTGKDTASWFIAVIRAATPELTNIYNISNADFSLDEITIGSGDEVHFVYSEDRDHDGVPASIEKIYGISDDNPDSDGDGISDYDEINGWMQDIIGYKVDSTGATVAIRDSVKHGPFYTNPAMENTDGDKYLDKDDPNPSAPELETDNHIEFVQVKDLANGLVKNVRKECIYDIFGNVCVDSLFVVDTIYNSAAEVLIKTRTNVADKGIQVSLRGQKINVMKESDMRYTFDITGISVVTKDTFDIKVVAENGNSSSYKLLVRSILAAPKNLELMGGADRSSIYVNYESDSSDSRINGYVILRAKSDKANEHNVFLSNYQLEPTTSKPATGMSLGNGISIVKINDRKAFSFIDQVGGGSPYYTYRVYSYVKQGSTYYFSKGSNLETKSAGRIKFEIQYVGSGAEYLWDYKHGSRKSFTLNAIFYEGTNPTSSPIHQYTYHYHKGGSSNHGNTIIYTSVADRDADHNTNSVMPDTTIYSAEIGSAGVMMSLNVISGNYGTEGHHNIIWPYNKLANYLNNEIDFILDSKDGNAPPSGWVEQKFNYGEKGVEYNPLNDNCNDKCGAEPHAGFKFKFNYSWVD